MSYISFQYEALDFELEKEIEEETRVRNILFSSYLISQAKTKDDYIKKIEYQRYKEFSDRDLGDDIMLDVCNILGYNCYPRTQ